MVFVAPSLPPILNMKGEKWCYFNKKTILLYFPKTFPNMKWSSFWCGCTRWWSPNVKRKKFPTWNIWSTATAGTRAARRAWLRFEGFFLSSHVNSYGESKKDPQNKIHMVNSFTTEFEKKRPTEVRRVSLNLYIYINIIYGESEKNNPKKWESFPETFRIDGSMDRCRCKPLCLTGGAKSSKIWWPHWIATPRVAASWDNAWSYGPRSIRS